MRLSGVSISTAPEASTRTPWSAKTARKARRPLTRRLTQVSGRDASQGFPIQTRSSRLKPPPSSPVPLAGGEFVAAYATDLSFEHPSDWYIPVADLVRIYARANRTVNASA